MSASIPESSDSSPGQVRPSGSAQADLVWPRGHIHTFYRGVLGFRAMQVTALASTILHLFPPYLSVYYVPVHLPLTFRPSHHSCFFSLL